MSWPVLFAALVYLYVVLAVIIGLLIWRDAGAIVAAGYAALLIGAVALL